MRESIFNILAKAAPPERALDLYAGSGALGLEALSRGADEVVFVADGKAAATGSHRGLLATESAYAATVNREDLISEERAS